MSFVWTLYFAESFCHIRHTQSCQLRERYVIFVVTDTHTPVVPSPAVCQILPSFLLTNFYYKRRHFEQHFCPRGWSLWRHHQSEEPLKVPSTFLFGVYRFGLRLSSPPPVPSCIMALVLFGREHQFTEICGLTGRWWRHQVFPPSSFHSRGSVCLHHSSLDSTFLYAICFAHCVHIYIDVMHIFYTCVTSWELYFVNTKDVYKYCLLCVNKTWWNVTFLCLYITQ